MKYVLLLSLILAGCAHVEPKTRFYVEVDSIVGTDVPNAKYKLLPGNKDVDENDLQFKEYANYIHRAMSYKGFISEEDMNKADIAVFLVYGIGEPVVNVESYAIPTWGQTGYSSTYTTGSVNAYGNTANYSQNTTLTPQYGVTGSRTGYNTITTYNRFMAISAINLRELKKTKKRIELWRTSVTSTGESDDLRRVFPVLATSAVGYLNKNTGSKVKFFIEEDHPHVLFIKGMISESELKGK